MNAETDEPLEALLTEAERVQLAADLKQMADLRRRVEAEHRTDVIS